MYYGGKELRKIRGRRSPQAAAKALGITVEALNAYEEGRRIPRDEVKKRILLYSQGKTPVQRDPGLWS